MRPVVLAAVGGFLLALGIGWAAYFAEIVYPLALMCPPGVSCAPLASLVDQPGLWYGIVTAIVGAVLVIVAFANWLGGRRHRASPIEASKVVD
jgi:ABC-type nitrate/sulfonate/bicarbonate transport system permease component